jgi:hypothetical protein
MKWFAQQKPLDRSLPRHLPVGLTQLSSIDCSFNHQLRVASVQHVAAVMFRLIHVYHVARNNLDLRAHPCCVPLSGPMTVGMIMYAERGLLVTLLRQLPSVEALVFRLQSGFTASFWVKIVVLVSLGLPQILVGGVLYKWASGLDWTTSLFTVYGVLYRIPGVAITREETLTATVVLNVIFMFGVFVFAILLGMIAEEIKLQIDRVRRGERHLVLSDHILVLGWNQGVPALLRQVAAAHQDPYNIFR